MAAGIKTITPRFFVSNEQVDDVVYDPIETWVCKCGLTFKPKRKEQTYCIPKPNQFKLTGTKTQD